MLRPLSRPGLSRASLAPLLLLAAAAAASASAAVACSSSSKGSPGATHDAGSQEDATSHTDGASHHDGSTRDGAAKDVATGTDGDGKTDAPGTNDAADDVITGGSDAGDDSGIAPPLMVPPPVADITWGTNTTFIDETQAASVVKSVDSLVALDGGTTQTITLDAAKVTAANLDLSVGRIVVIYGQVMRLITGSSTSGGNLVLETGDTSFEDAASEANLQWVQATELSPSAAMAALHDAVRTGRLKVHHNLTVTRGNLDFTASAGGYNFDIKLAMHGDTADVNIVVTKTGDMEKLTVTGQIGRSVTTHSVKVHAHKLTEYATSSAGVQGTLTVAVTAVGSGMDALNYSTELPIFKFPFLVGPIPVVESISAQFVANGLVNSSCSVNVAGSFDYDSTLGVSFAGGSITTTGTEGSPTIMQTTTPHSACAGDVAFSAGLGFPRLSLDFFGGTLVGSMQPAYVAGGDYTAFPACQTANAEFLASVSYSLKILGLVPLGSGSKTLFDTKKNLLSVGAGCPDAG